MHNSLKVRYALVTKTALFRQS